MTPENTSEGSGSAAPEDTLFGDSSLPAQNSQPAAPQHPDAPPAGEPIDLSGDDNVDPANSLDDPSPADALGKEGEHEGAEAQKASTTYEAFEIPEGSTTLGEDVVAAFSTAASDAGLSQEQAQKIINAIGPAQLKAQQAVVDDAHTSWVKQTRSDKEVGGANYKTSLNNMRIAVGKFATPEFKQLLVGEHTRLANHPEMLRFLSRVGAALSPDRSLVSGGKASTPKVNIQDPMATEDATAEMLFGAIS